MAIIEFSRKMVKGLTETGIEIVLDKQIKTLSEVEFKDPEALKEKIRELSIQHEKVSQDSWLQMAMTYKKPVEITYPTEGVKKTYIPVSKILEGKEKLDKKKQR